LKAIESICKEDGIEKGNVLDTLSQLVDKSLVVAIRRSGERRYSLLETIREFALEKLAQSQEMISTKDRHLDYYLQFAEDAEPKIKGSEQFIWYERLETEHDNLRAALGWALESKNADAGLRLAGSLGFFWFVRGHIREGVVWLEKVSEREQGASFGSQAKALRYLGSMLIFSENQDFEQISTILEKSLELYREVDDRSGIAWVLNQLGLIAYIHGEFTKAQQLLEESLVLREQVGNAWDIAQTLGNFATVALRRNDLVSAREYSEKAIAWFQQAGDRRGAAMNTGELAEIVQMEGDYERAFTLLTQTLSQLAKFDDSWSTALTLESLANLACERGDPKRGAILYGAAEALREDVGMPLTPDHYETYEEDMTAARKELGVKVFTRAQAQGRAMTLEEVIDFVLQGPETPSTPQTEKKRVGGLTRREREAAVLIAEGKSNRDIAEAMTVTEKTVEAYVTRILRKLGFDSRVQIAIWVIDNDLS
jgi:non-specific serine/threonine protein kinase